MDTSGVLVVEQVQQPLQIVSPFSGLGGRWVKSATEICTQEYLHPARHRRRPRGDSGGHGGAHNQGGRKRNARDPVRGAFEVPSGLRSNSSHDDNFRGQIALTRETRVM